MYKVVSLFSGCGGADCGILGGFDFNNIHYDRLPFELVYASDIDKKAVATHKENFETAQLVCKDICDTPSSEIPDHPFYISALLCIMDAGVEGIRKPQHRIAAGWGSRRQIGI